MKKLVGLICLLIILVSITGCIRIKAQDCPPLSEGIGVGGATSVISAPDVDVTEEPVESTGDVQVKEVNMYDFDLTAEEEALPKKEVVEGDLVNFPNLDATDPDGDPIEYTFSEPLNSKGEWLTQVGDAGKYTVTVTASDGKNTVDQLVLVLVRPSNQLPVIVQENLVLNEGDVLNVDAQVSDPDGDEVTITYEGWKTEFPYTLGFDDAGTHYITVRATDGKGTVEKEVQVLVRDLNRPPELEPIDDLVIKEFDEITLQPKANDPEGDAITFTYSEPLDAAGTWQTQKGDAGKYDITVTASDGDTQASTTFSVVVESFNEPPIISGAQDVTVNEGDVVRLDVSAVDPEGNEVELTISGWMDSDTKEAGYGDAGEHEVLIEASDGEVTAQETITVTVKDVNRAPVFGSGAFE